MFQRSLIQLAFVFSVVEAVVAASASAAVLAMTVFAVESFEPAVAVVGPAGPADQKAVAGTVEVHQLVVGPQHLLHQVASVTVAQAVVRICGTAPI